MAEKTAPADPVDLAGSVAIRGIRFRHLDRGRDYEAVAEVLSTANRHDGVDWLPTAEELRHDWEGNPGLDPDRDLLVAEVDGTLLAVVSHDWRMRGERVVHHLDPVVLPDWRHRGIGRALLRWVEERAVTGTAAGTMGSLEVPHMLAGWADLDVPDAARFAAAAGYAADGYGIMMLRSLTEPIPDAPLPAGLEVRPVRPEDHRRLWDADTEAFRDDRDPAVRTDADFERWFSKPGLDTSIWEVAWDGDEIAGSVWNMIFPEDNEKLGIKRGWLEHVSVRRPWRRRGLATALMARSMRRLRDLGMTEAALGADADNISGAVRVYEALGFRRYRTAARYVKPLPGPGVGA